MTRFPIVNWWIARKLGSVYWLMAAAGVLACLAGLVSGQEQFGRYGMAALVLLAVVFISHEHLYQFHHYLKNYGDCCQVPLKRMKQVNGLLTILFQAAFLAIAWGGLFLPWKRAGELFKKGILVFFRWIGRLIPPAEENIIEESGGMPGEFSMPHLPPGETSPLAELLDKVFSTLFFLLAAAFLVWLAVQGVKKLAAYLGSFTLDEDEAVFLLPESAREKVKKEEKLVKIRMKQIFGLEPKMRIRKIYKTCIREGISRKRAEGDIPGCAAAEPGRLSFLTPCQLEKEAGIGEACLPSSLPLHGLYEKARYGNEACSKEEEELMKACAGRLREFWL